MIDVGFVNLIMIIADNTFSSRELYSCCLSISVVPGIFRSFATIGFGSPRSFFPVAPGNFHYSASVRFGSPHPFVPVESSDLSNFIPDFLPNVLANPLRYFSVDVFSDFAIALASSSALLFLFDFPALSQFLQDNFPALVVDVLSVFGRDVPPNHFSSADHPLLPPLPPSGNSTTSDHLFSLGCLLLSPILPLGDSTTLFALGRDVLLDYPPDLGPLPSFPPLSNFTSASSALGRDVLLDYSFNSDLLSYLLPLGNSTYD